MYQAQTRGFNILADIAALGLPYQATGVATTRKFIRERTDVVRRYIKAHIEAVYRFKTDRETSMKVLANALTLTDKQLLEELTTARSPSINCRRSSIQPWRD